jgi:hypothetical protein
MRHLIRSPRKPPIGAAWPPGFAGAYPPGLIAAFFINEGGAPSTLNAEFTWDSLKNLPLLVDTTGAAPTWVPDHGGMALTFNGSQWLGGESVYTAALDPMTWAFWCIPGSSGCMIAKNDANTIEYGWLIGVSSTHVTLGIVGSVSNQYVPSNVPSNWVGNWHHVVVTWDGVFPGTGFEATFYIDGIYVGSSVGGQAGNGTHGSDAGYPLRIGRTTGSFGQGGGNWTGGTLESVLMFNRQLTQSEAVSLMRSSYRWYGVRKAYPATAPAKVFAATAAQKTGLLGRLTHIGSQLAAAHHTLQGSLTTLFVRFRSFAATAAQKTASLTAALVPIKILSASALQKSGALARNVYIKLAATHHTLQGTLSAVLAANQKTFSATVAQKTGTISRTTMIGAQVKAVKAQLQGKLTLRVTHAPPPPVPTPVVCPTVVPSISHVETCENTGS